MASRAEPGGNYPRLCFEQRPLSIFLGVEIAVSRLFVWRAEGPAGLVFGQVVAK